MRVLALLLVGIALAAATETDVASESGGEEMITVTSTISHGGEATVVMVNDCQRDEKGECDTKKVKAQSNAAQTDAEADADKPKSKDKSEDEEERVDPYKLKVAIPMSQILDPFKLKPVHSVFKCQNLLDPIQINRCMECFRKGSPAPWEALAFHPASQQCALQHQFIPTAFVETTDTAEAEDEDEAEDEGEADEAEEDEDMLEDEDEAEDEAEEEADEGDEQSDETDEQDEDHDQSEDQSEAEEQDEESDEEGDEQEEDSADSELTALLQLASDEGQEAESEAADDEAEEAEDDAEEIMDAEEETVFLQSSIERLDQQLNAFRMENQVQPSTTS